MILPSNFAGKFRRHSTSISEVISSHCLKTRKAIMVKKAAQATPNWLLRAARKDRGWTQQEVADRIGAPLALNISRWESGTAFPSAYYIERLCQLFGKSIRELGLSQLDEETQGDYPSPPVRREQIPSSSIEEAWREEMRTPGHLISTSEPPIQYGHRADL